MTAKTLPVKLEEEMSRSYIDYAMSVIVGRALPDVRDGLKPVHRRIIYAMGEAGLTPDKVHKKSARVVGDVLAHYHPHGDAAVYDSMVRMAQDFSIRYPLVDGHGNFGSVDGDSPAAMRYTEARLTTLAMEMLADIEKETVDFQPNYDDSQKEPTVLPARLPNLLVNGSSGIAVGMATNIPPHNLGEVVDALLHLIENPDATFTELMLFIKGPDFPTGGLIIGRDGIHAAYQSGRGSITVRARASIEESKGGKNQLVVTEIPYLVNKARLIEQIADLVREKKLEGITDLRDESDRNGMRVVVELRRDVQPQVVLNNLYKHTKMQDTFGVIMLALVNSEPRVLNLKDMLLHYLRHRQEVVEHRTLFDLKKARERAHIVEGLRIALHHLDEVIKTIRGSATPDIARQALMERFGLSEKQAQAILDMRLQRLTALERDKLEKEYNELVARMAELEGILDDDQKILDIIKEELQYIKKKYTDTRRTGIQAREDNFTPEDLIPEEELVVTITHRGYAKRLPLSTYRSQRRGGRGVTGVTTREADFVEHLFTCSSHDYLLFFTSRGRAYRLKVHELPEGSRQARGSALVNLLNLSQEEKVTAVITVPIFEQEVYLFMATSAGTVKKTPLIEYNTSRRDGLIALDLVKSDELIGVLLTRPGQEVIIGTKKGQAIRFAEERVRPMGRQAHGVRGIDLVEGDRVLGLDLVEKEADLLTVSENGFTKRTSLEEYRSQKRGGRGLLIGRLNERTGPLAGLLVVKPEDEVMAISAEGTVIRLACSDVSRLGRTSRGVTLMRLPEGVRVVAVARVVSKEEEE